MCFIYALCEPDSYEVRYVGKAKDLKVRLQAHKNEKRTTRKCRWLNSLKKKGLEPLVLILEEINDKDWQTAERGWIKNLRHLGYDLTNHTGGGDGVSGLDEESRKKLSKIISERMSNPEFKKKIFTEDRARKISEALSGKPKSKEHIAKLKQNQKGWKHKPESIEKLREAGRKRPFTDEHRKKGQEKLAQMRASGILIGKGNKSRKGQKRGPEELKRASESLKGKKKSEEHRKQLSLAAFRRWARQKEEAKNANQVSRDLESKENPSDRKGETGAD